MAGIAPAIGVVGQWFGWFPLVGAGFGFVLSGCIGGALWASSATRATSAMRGAVAFGGGFIIPGIVIPFSIFSVGFLGAAISWGLGLGLGAGLAGLLLLLSDSSARIRVSLAAATAFLIGGLTGGPLAYTLFGLAGDSGLALLAFPTGLFLAYALGGALFALIFGIRGTRPDGGKKERSHSRLAMLSVISVAGVVTVCITYFRLRYLGRRPRTVR